MYYNLETNKVKVGTQKATEAPISMFIVGEYQFYTSYVGYGPFLAGYRCYYLHRVTDGKDEILQYYFWERSDEPNPILFEDIYVK